jgi:multiple sugar transport system permease protein
MSHAPNQWKAGALFFLPAGSLLTLAIILPFILALVITFTNQRLLSPNPTEFIGLENYQRLLSLNVLVLDRAKPNEAADSEGFVKLRSVVRADPALRGFQHLADVTLGDRKFVLVATDPIFYKSLRNTFLFVILVLPLQCSLALGLAILVNKAIPARTLFRTLYFSPVVMSMVIVSIIWFFIYNTNSGLLNQLIGNLAGGGTANIDWLGSTKLALPSIVILSAWQGAGFQMLIFLAGLQSIPKELYEAAKLDGATPWQQFRHVTLPGLRNTIVFVLIATSIAAFSLFVQVAVMTQGGPKDSTSTLIYHAVRTGFNEQDVAYGATVAVVFFVLVLSVSLIQRYLTRDHA